MISEKFTEEMLIFTQFNFALYGRALINKLQKQIKSAGYCFIFSIFNTISYGENTEKP